MKSVPAFAIWPQLGSPRPDACLGLINNQKVADRLKEAGLECYCHKPGKFQTFFFPRHCTTHTYEDPA